MPSPKPLKFSRADFLAAAFAVLIGLSPFVFDLSYAPKGWELPKVHAVQIFLLLVLSIYLVWVIAGAKAKNRILQSKDHTVLLVMGIIAVGSLLAPVVYKLRIEELYNPLYHLLLSSQNGEYLLRMGLFGNEFRESGLITMLLLFAASWAALREISARQLPYIFGFLAASAVLQAILGVFQFLAKGISDQARFLDGRVVYGTFGQNNWYAGFLLLGFVACAYFLGRKEAWVRACAASAGLIISAAVILSLSYFSYLVLALTILLLLLWGTRKNHKQYITRLKHLCLALLVFVFPLAILILQAAPYFMHRINIWNAVLDQYLLEPFRHPENISLWLRILFGSGFDTLQEVLYPLPLFDHANIDRAHNVVFDVLAWTGVTGLALAGICMKKIAAVASRVNSAEVQFGVMLVIVWLMRSLIHTSSIVHLLIIFVLTGALLGAGSRSVKAEA